MCASLLVSLLSASPFSSLWGAHNIEFWRCCSSCPCSPGLSDTLFQMRRVCMCTCLIGWTRLLLLQDQTQTSHQQPDSFSAQILPCRRTRLRSRFRTRRFHIVPTCHSLPRRARCSARNVSSALSRSARSCLLSVLLRGADFVLAL